MKNNFIKYPAIIFSVLLIISLYILLLAPEYIKIIVWTSALLSALVFTVIKIKCKSSKLSLFTKYALLLCITLIFSIIIQLVRYDIPMSKAKQYIGKEADTIAYVKEIYYSLDYMSAAKCVVTEIDGKECNIPVYAKFDTALELEEFDYFNASFEFYDIQSAQDSYNTKYSFIASDMRLLATSDAPPTQTGEKATGIVPFFSSINKSICNRVSSILDSTSAGLVNALLFGNKDGLTSSVKRDFNTLGITHLLVVSGMNIAIIAGMFEFVLLYIFRMKRWQRSVICSIISIVYMALCGFSLTVIRAALMQVLCRLSINAKAQYHTPTSLFVSIAVICSIFPGAIYDIGLILSFLATLGIISFGQYADSSIRKLPTLIKSIASSLIASLAACIFVLPVSYYVFGSFSMLSPVATLIFGVFLDILLYTAPILLISSFIPILGSAVAFAVDFICSAVLKLTSFAYVFKDFYVSFNYFGVEILITLLIICVIAGYLLKTKHKILKTLPALTIFFAICVTSYINSDLEGIYYYTENSNDVIIMNTDKNNAVIDVSTGSKTFADKTVSSLYFDFNTMSPDSYVLTHYHTRHITSIDYLANNTYIERLLIPEPITDEELEIYREICMSANKYGIELEVYKNSFSCGGGKFTKEENLYIDRSTHPIISFTFIYDGKSFSYFSGGAFESRGENIDKYAKADYLIFGSHGPLIKEKISSCNFKTSSIAYFSNEEIYGYCIFSFDQSYIGPHTVYIP